MNLSCLPGFCTAVLIALAPAGSAWAWTGTNSASAPRAEAPIVNRGPVNNCDIPFSRLGDDQRGFQPFQKTAALNGDASVEEVYRGRYVVANLNSVGDDGLCKGVQEAYPAVDDYSRFPDLSSPQQIAHYRATVQRLWVPPFSQARSISYRGEQLCVGQTISLCELGRTGQSEEVARFVTSGLDYKQWGSGGPRRGYYAPINVINRRSWEAAGIRPYSSDDADRDARMGGVADGRATGATLDLFKTVIMPNFMNFIPLTGYWGDSRNGIHGRVNTEGPGTEDDLGVPASLGCLRVTYYASRFIRWWVPRNARMFIFFDPRQIRQICPS